MAPNEDPKPFRDGDDEKDAVSLESNPPVDELSEPSDRPGTPPEGEPSSPEAEAKEALPELKSADELSPGQMIGNYRIEKRIGRGGMATVYKCFDVQRQRDVAVKILREKFSSSLKALARFDREFFALEALDHPNIVRVLDKGVERGMNYFVMEYVNGASLSRLLKHRKFALNTKAQILLHVAAALDYAHRKGIVHRDVKPDNVLIDRTGRAKLADFGIAQITKSNLPLTSITVASSFMGTADYMAPEQRLDAKSVDHRADIFAFGVMLYETFTEKLPLGNFPLPSHLNPELSKRMDGIILRAMRQNPDERYQTIIDLAADLKREMQTTSLSRLKARLALMFQPDNFKRLVSARAVTAVLVLAGIVAGLLWFFPGLGEFSSPTPRTTVNQPTVAPETPPTSVRPEATPGDKNLPHNMALIPAGEFIMGNDSEFLNERPQRRVYLDAFYIDKFEVTNAEYKEFVDATGRAVPFVNAFWAEPFNWRNGTYPPGKGDYPVVLATWYDAAAYAKWAGKRLPTEAEWERAARGADGRTWPWGNAWDVNKCNVKESFINSTQPVYLFGDGVSPAGCYNMAGNAMEWTADWYAETYYKQAPSTNPPGPSTGLQKVARGGAWDSNLNLYARTGYRHYFQPKTANPGIGFRCAKDAT